jgi:hypothetical protein
VADPHLHADGDSHQAAASANPHAVADFGFAATSYRYTDAG